MPKAGEKYRHYKGNDYEVLYIGKHTETEEELVIYRALKTPDQIWVRPLSMFMGEIEVDGVKKSRFAYIGE